MTQWQITHTCCVDFPHNAGMSSAALKLKELRKSAIPALTVRGMADELGVPFGTYSSYETPARYKKPFLPLDLTRRIATVLTERGVDPSEVMKLAGLTDEETGPEARLVEASRPQVQFVSLQLALPSEAALRDMFRSLLVLVPEGASMDEAAEILARRLPSGIAAIGPVVLDPVSVESTDAAEALQPRARGRRASSQSSRI
jgi:hypothetical protein